MTASTIPVWLVAIAITTVCAAGHASTALAQNFASYHCRDGSQFVAAFFDDTRTVYLQLDGHTLTLPRRLSLTGSRYAKGGVTLFINRQSVTLKRSRTSTQCTAD